MLVRRKNLPKRVSLSESGRSLPSESRLSVIVRNLSIINSRPPKPPRGWLNITGAPSFILTSNAVIKNTGKSKKRKIHAKSTSSVRLTHLSYIFLFLLFFISLNLLVYRKNSILIKFVFSGASPSKKHLSGEPSEPARRGELQKSKIFASGDKRANPRRAVFNCKTQFYNWLIFL